MTFSVEWNTAYENGQTPNKGIDPNVIWLFNMVIGTIKGQRVLEFGCGAGSNASAFIASGAEYYGIDGCRSAVLKAAENPDNNGGHFACADFTKEHPFAGDFDIVFDRAAISHNDTAGIKAAVKLAYDSLKPGGIFIGADWFSTAHSEFTRGERVDNLTRTGYKDGQFRNVGKCHFTNQQELAIFFTEFERMLCHHRVTRYIAPGVFLPERATYRWISSDFNGVNYDSAVFDIAARKPR